MTYRQFSVSRRLILDSIFASLLNVKQMFMEKLSKNGSPHRYDPPIIEMTRRRLDDDGDNLILRVHLYHVHRLWVFDREKPKDDVSLRCGLTAEQLGEGIVSIK